jgi:hypothetical protein
VVELPFTVYSPLLRVPTTLSACRLLGRPFTALLVNRPPPVVVCNLHMHDLVTPPAYRRLPRGYKAVYGRNDRGFDILENVLDRFEAAGYAFDTLGTAAETLRATPSATERGLDTP